MHDTEQACPLAGRMKRGNECVRTYVRSVACRCGSLANRDSRYVDVEYLIRDSKRMRNDTDRHILYLTGRMDVETNM
jgi:hypothetical protein